MRKENTETTVLGGGCFWCLEAVYEQIEGVESVTNGYSGGHVDLPTYEQVCSETTGHAEVVEVIFDVEKISYKEILEIFFVIHDPTTPNRQGYDIGSSYRSVIFYNNPEQRLMAEETIANIERSKVWENPVITELTGFEKFYKAEDYHQKYYMRNTYQPYCQIVISPKLAKIRREYLSRLKPVTLHEN